MNKRPTYVCIFWILDCWGIPVAAPRERSDCSFAQYGRSYTAIPSGWNTRDCEAFSDPIFLRWNLRLQVQGYSGRVVAPQTERPFSTFPTGPCYKRKIGERVALLCNLVSWGRPATPHRFSDYRIWGVGCLFDLPDGLPSV